MRYIGNKENIIQKIQSLLQLHKVKGDSIFDFFAGTTNVGQFYKRKGYRVCSSDMMYFSYCLQKAYIENNAEPVFPLLFKEIKVDSTVLFSSPLERVVEYLNGLEGSEGFIFKHYTPQGTQELKQPRMYFSSENGRKIDSIRQKIQEWKENALIQDMEYFCLLACLIESVSFYANVAGVYAAFQKKWDPRALKPFSLRTIPIISSEKECKAYFGNSLDLLDKIKTDILYLDPPYNERQYAPNYHLLETIARYDNPQIRGVTGMRDYNSQKSSFCSTVGALRDLEAIAQRGEYKYLVMSYNSEGIMHKDDIMQTLAKYGSVAFEQFEYTRFKSNSNGLSATKKNIFEQLYILSR